MCNICSTSSQRLQHQHGSTIDEHDQLKRSYAIHRKYGRTWVHIFLHLLHICRVSAFIMFQISYQKWNCGPMEEKPPCLLDQKEFSSASEIVVWHLHFPTANWKTMCRLLVFSLLADHDSGNVRFGCLQCRVRLCQNHTLS